MSFDPNLPPEEPPGPPPPSPLEAPFAPAGVTEGTGLPRNIAAALACIFPLLGGLVFYIMDRRDRFVRFYALQSIVLSLIFFVIDIALNVSSFILTRIPLVGWLFAMLFGALAWVFGLLFLILWISLVWNAYRGQTFEMPVLWRFAKRHIPQALL